MRSFEEYLDKLREMRPNVYIGGEAVRRDDPRLMPGVKVIGETYKLPKDPVWEKLITAKSSLIDKRVNRFNFLPQTPYDLIQKQKMIRLGAQRVGGCIQRCMGLDAIIALSICTKEIDEKYGTDYHKRFQEFLKYFQEQDLCAACAQTDAKGDRSKRPSQQADPDTYVHVVDVKSDGIIVRGAKISITMVAYADEIIVLPTRALREDEREYAVAFAIPADWENVYLITRPVWIRERKLHKAPFSEYGVSDSVVVFDNTFIPKERVFMCGEWDFARRLALLFANSHRHSYCGCKPAVSDILCGAATLIAEVNNIEKFSHVREKLSEFVGAAELAFSAGIAAAVYGERTTSGTFFPNPIYANVGRRLMGETIYNEYKMLVEIAGGLSVTLPFEDDFISNNTKSFLEKYIVRNSKFSSEESHIIWRFIENVVASSMSAWYQVAGVHGGGSPIMETITLNAEYDYEYRKSIAKFLSGLEGNLDQTRYLNMEPCEEIYKNNKKED